MHATTTTQRDRMADDRAQFAQRLDWTRNSSMACQIEGTFRAASSATAIDDDHPGHLEQLEGWMKSYRPEELFDEHGETD